MCVGFITKNLFRYGRDTIAGWMASQPSPVRGDGHVGLLRTRNAAHRLFLAFAASCALGSAYGFLQGAWPFGLVEAIWALVALRRWHYAGYLGTHGRAFGERDDRVVAGWTAGARGRAWKKTPRLAL
jgi:hypothetical protein